MKRLMKEWRKEEKSVKKRKKKDFLVNKDKEKESRCVKEGKGKRKNNYSR